MTFQPSGKRWGETTEEYYRRRFDEIVAENIRREAQAYRERQDVLHHDALQLRRDQGSPEKDC